jgi:hypothetical protein
MKPVHPDTIELILIDMSDSHGKSPTRLWVRAVQNVAFSFGRTTERRMLPITVVVLFGCFGAVMAQAQLYAGVLGGVSTLSGDARSVLSSDVTAFSSYNPKNGGAVEVLFGKHFSDYFTLQADYVWNRNALTLTSAAFHNGTQQGYQETRGSSQQSAIADVLIYFRKRDSRLRPYLSVGIGIVHFASSVRRIEQVLGTPNLPPQSFSSNMIALNVPVGMDVNLGKGWVFRYTFSETISQNPISDRLLPQGQHSLKNFQNLFGFTKRF